MRLATHIFKTHNRRFAAQFFEGMHGLYDKPNVATVAFPEGSARKIDVYGKPRSDEIGGTIIMGVGCGDHTPYAAELVLTESGVPLSVFKEVLVKGVISERKTGISSRIQAYE